VDIIDIKMHIAEVQQSAQKMLMDVMVNKHKEAKNHVLY